MPSDERRLRHLLRLFADNKATEKEIPEMLDLLRQQDGNGILDSFLMEIAHEPDHSHTQPAIDWNGIFDKIHQATIDPPHASIYKMKWLPRVAAVLVIIGVGAYFFFRSPQKELAKAEPSKEVTKDVPPGGSKAILTLANGSQIVLDNASPGKLAQQGNVSVVKHDNGQLVYTGTSNASAEPMYNTVNTPRGGQYQIILPDGTAVWLNAISSISYPTFFNKSERVVEITGEAYFEVAKDRSRPFKVMIKSHSGRPDMQVAVLGTHFNINAYNDEPAIKTTLLEGSIRVSTGAVSSNIKPGQQAELGSNGKIKVLNDANLNETIAWKEGRFEFNDADLKTILRQVMRWYDVDVEYRGDVSDRIFTAAISRNKTLYGLLNILRQSDIEFKLKGNKLEVTQ